MRTDNSEVRMARPSKPSNERLTATVTVRFTAEDYARIVKRSHNLGVTPRELVYAATMLAIKR
jgi:hypothetical protein